MCPEPDKTRKWGPLLWRRWGARHRIDLGRLHLTWRDPFYVAPRPAPKVYPGQPKPFDTEWLHRG